MLNIGARMNGCVLGCKQCEKPCGDPVLSINNNNNIIFAVFFKVSTAFLVFKKQSGARSFKNAASKL